jgi:hypothetical protein
MRLLQEGHRAIRGVRDNEVAARRAGVEAASGALTGTYPNGCLQDLRDDRPA